ncbi:MAG TPA: YafY family protein [Vicinamibacterales bacterium]|nr:YafY family protein [Vicinamibacterales bacterium]
MTRTERLLTLIQALRRHRRPVTAQQLATELSVSVRTIYRDIETLVGQGASIAGEAGVGFVMRPGFMLPPLMFQDEEIEALMLGSRWVAQLPDAPLARAAADAVAKIMAVLPDRLQHRVEDAGLFAVPRTAAALDRIDASVVRAAIRAERKLRIAYLSGDDKATVRVIWPIAVAFFERVRVVVAWCELRHAFRHFRTDRITLAESTGEPLPRRRLQLLSEWREAVALAATVNGSTADRN